MSEAIGDINELLEQKKEPKYLGKFIKPDDMIFLQRVNGYWFQQIQKDLDPKMYLTGSYEEELKIQQRLMQILEIPELC